MLMHSEVWFILWHLIPERYYYIYVNESFDDKNKKILKMD